MALLIGRDHVASCNYGAHHILLYVYACAYVIAIAYMTPENTDVFKYSYFYQELYNANKASTTRIDQGTS